MNDGNSLNPEGKNGALHSATQGQHRHWGINNDYTTLRDVLLGRPDYYRWVEDYRPDPRKCRQNRCTL